ncbi:efflux RND transporter permease subunit [Piscirickettsia litoralis]|uniref:Uncharacterized protein n=1 Tax=Piscirickettsia litoralis TaxID=1891921 RepID=A0ABX2ZZZ6_9GAMM|nr:efflux RND transporter permease subunit [Piscirickettsia litoralis]ODN42177.1 hypothetical protein BGC07_03485 [Piscirickettsia litoralis]
MIFIEACIKNKLIVYIIALAICLAGLFCLYITPIAPFPAMAGHNINIKFSYPGANAQTVQQQVTTEVSTRLQSINNLQYMRANTQAGSANITLALNSNSTEQLLQVQMEVMQAIASAHLPNSVPQPAIRPSASNSGLVDYVVSSNKANLFEISNFIHAVLLPKFNSLPQVQADADDLDPVVKIQLRPADLVKYHLNPTNVTQTINQNYQSSPLGDLYINKQQYVLNMEDNFNSLYRLRHLIVGYQHANKVQASEPLGLPIYLQDIATVSFEPRSTIDQPFSSFNGQTAGVLALHTTQLADPFSISKISHDYINKLQGNLPKGVKVTPVFDMANIMQTSIEEVSFTILIASILVLLVALVFFRPSSCDSDTDYYYSHLSAWGDGFCQCAGG